jgi:hypothetical protein
MDARANLRRARRTAGGIDFDMKNLLFGQEVGHP